MNPENFSMSPETLYASVYLEHHGHVFSENFNAGDAIDTAAKMVCEFFDEELNWEEQIKFIRITGFSDWT